MVSPVEYEVSIVCNLPIPEDEIEEKNMDLSEVESKTISRKAYMKKWRGLNDDEVQEELEQIALERQMLEESSFAASCNTEPYPFGGTGNQDEHTGELVDDIKEDQTE